MSNRTTFRLPGHNFHPLAECKTLLSLLAAYSRQWNPRNLEYPWYEPWDQILGALVAEHPSLSVAPQPYLWYDVLSLSSQARTTPGPPRLLIPKDGQWDDLLEYSDVGNTSLDSIRTISVPSHRNRARFPDFAITRKVSFPLSTNTHDLLQLTRRLTYVGFPLLAELKASGHRSDDIETSLLNAELPMTLAQESVMKQASHLFKMYPHQDNVLLVAITGFWWSYRIYSRAEENLATVGDEGRDGNEDADKLEDELHEEPDPTFPDQDGIHDPSPQNPSQLDETSAQALQEQLRAYGFTLSNLEGLPEGVRFHTVIETGKLALRRGGGWSDYLLYGTAPSNQVFSLIHDYLHDVIHVHYDGTRG